MQLSNAIVQRGFPAGLTFRCVGSSVSDHSFYRQMKTQVVGFFPNVIPRALCSLISSKFGPFKDKEKKLQNLKFSLKIKQSKMAAPNPLNGSNQTAVCI